MKTARDILGSLGLMAAAAILIAVPIILLMGAYAQRTCYVDHLPYC